MKTLYYQHKLNTTGWEIEFDFKLFIQYKITADDSFCLPTG